MNTRSRTTAALQADIEVAIAEERLSLAYQPQVDLVTGRWIGVEALARWQRPGRGEVPPAEFIPLVEQSGLIGALGSHMLRTACADLAILQDRFGTSVPRVSVNVSALQLLQPDFTDVVGSSLTPARLDPTALCLELTESVALGEGDPPRRALCSIAQSGVQLSIDDFGAGYSTFASLARAPWSELKLDGCLIDNFRSPSGRKILRSILALGATLGLPIIAERVENAAQLAVLRALGCEYGQGYALGRPQPLEQLIATLESGRTRPRVPAVACR